MITETQTTIIVLQLSDELFVQLHPFLTTGHYRHYTALTMGAEASETLVERVSSTLDYDVRWQPNAYEPNGFSVCGRLFVLLHLLLLSFWSVTAFVYNVPVPVT